jgi:hypothetical protein
MPKTAHPVTTHKNNETDKIIRKGNNLYKIIPTFP